jgi:putative ABC transport system permease protein
VISVPLKLAWRYLWGRKLRTALTTLAVVLGVAVLFSMNSLLPTFISAFSNSLLQSSGSVDLTVTTQSGDTFPGGVLATVGSIAGIATASPSLHRTVSLPADKFNVTQVSVAGVDPASATKLRDYPVAAGRFLQAGDGDVVVLPKDLAAQLSVKVGSNLTLPSSVGSTRFQVVGLLQAPSVPGVEEIDIPLASAQRLFADATNISQIDASYRQGTDRTAITAAVTRKLGSAYSIGGIDTGSTIYASLQTGQYAFNLFGIFALVMGGFIILNTFRTVVSERRHDIGMLRAIGASRGLILGMFLVESTIQGVLGTAIGIVVGGSFALLLINGMRGIVTSLLRVSVSGIVISPSAFIQAAVLGVGITVASALLPALSASRITPMEALRPALGEEVEKSAGRRAAIGIAITLLSIVMLLSGNTAAVGLGSVAFLVGMVLVAPQAISPFTDWIGRVFAPLFRSEGQLARSNVTRNLGRAAATVSAIMISLSIVLATLGFVVSIFAAFLSYLDKSLGADFLVIPTSILLSGGNVGAGPKLANDMRHTPGVGVVTTLRVGRAKANGNDLNVVGIDPKTYLQVATFEWSQGGSDADVAQLGQGRTLIVNAIYAAQARVGIGSSLALETPQGMKQYRVVGVGNDYLNAKLATVYVSQDNLAKDFNQTVDLLLLANAQPGSALPQVQSQLNKIVSQYPAFKLYSTSEWRTTQTTIFDQTLGIFYGLVIALALPSLLALINTLAISVLARTREIGMLRAVGTTRTQVRRMVMAESLILASIGTLFGVVAGIWLGYSIVTVTSSLAYPMTYSFPTGSIVITAAVGLFFGVLAAVIPARQATKMDVVAALHYE